MTTNIRWTEEEVNLLEESIKNGKSLEEIAEVITLRTDGAIKTKANILGYGHYIDRIDELTYFKSKNNFISKLKTNMDINEFDKIITLYQDMIAPIQDTIAQLEKTKRMLWKH